MATESTPSVPVSASEAIPFKTTDLGVDLAGASPTSLQSPPTAAREYGFDDENVKQYDFEFYKGRKGVTDRICLLSTPLGARCHFKEGIGYFICLSEFKQQTIGGSSSEVCVKRAACCVHTENTRKRFVVPVIQYATQPTGTPLPDFGFVLKAWLYSDDKYITLKTINSEFPLLDHDLLVTCTEEQYQKLTIAACRAAIWKKIPQQLQNDIKLWSDSMKPKMGKMLGKTITEQEFMIKAGLQAPTVAAPAMDQPMVDLKGLLDET